MLVYGFTHSLPAAGGILIPTRIPDDTLSFYGLMPHDEESTTIQPSLTELKAVTMGQTSFRHP